MKNEKKTLSSCSTLAAAFPKPWKNRKSQNLLEDLPWLKISVDSVLLPNGKEIENFYQIELPEYAVVVAQTEDGLILMERQYKHAIGKIILNLPSGYLDSHETPLACAQRELLEETGFMANSWQHLGSFCVDGNRGCGKMHAFAASGAYCAAEPQNEDTEEIEVIQKKPEDVLRALIHGELETLGPAFAVGLAFLCPSSPLHHLSHNLKMI